MSARFVIASGVSALTLVAISRVGYFQPVDGYASIVVAVLWVLMPALLGLCFVDWILAGALDLHGRSLSGAVAVGAVSTTLVWVGTYWAGLYVIDALAGNAEPGPAWASSFGIPLLALVVLTFEAVLLSAAVARRFASAQPAQQALPGASNVD